MAEDEEKARKLNESAIKAYKDQKFLEAIDFWLQACEYANVEQLIKLHKNLGLALHKLEREAEAWYHLTLFMKRAPGTDAGVAKTVQELEESLRKLHIKVRIDSQPTGATVLLPPGDRMHTLKTPFAWWLPQGEYGLELKLPDYKDSKQTLRVSVDGTDSFTFILEPLPKTGLLKLVGKSEGSSVRVNGKVQGPIPYEADLLPGKYKVEVHYASGESWSDEVEVKIGRTTERKVVFGVAVKPIKPGRPSGGDSTWKWITLGAGVALVASGGLFSSIAAGGIDEYDKVNQKYAGIKSASDPQYLSAYIPEYNAVWGDHIEPYLNTSYVLYGLGGAAIVTSVSALLFMDRSSDADTTLGLVPIVGPGHAGACITF